MVNETPINSIEIFQKELAELNKVNKEARAQRIELEDELKMDPFVEHLYSEGEFEKLIFFECRTTNVLLRQVIDLLSDKRQGVEDTVSPVEVLQGIIDDAKAIGVAVECIPVNENVTPCIPVKDAEEIDTKMRRSSSIVKRRG